MKTYHDTTTGKFVSKERVKNDPAGTVEITSVDLRQELIEFAIRMDGITREQAELEVDEYLKQR